MNWNSSTCNAVIREALINAFSEVEFIEVKEFDSTHEIWKTLEAFYKGDKYIKQELGCKLGKQSWKT